MCLGVCKYVQSVGVSLFVSTCIYLPALHAQLWPQKVIDFDPEFNLLTATDKGKESVDNLSSYICDYYTPEEVKWFNDSRSTSRPCLIDCG